jgi:hypothetical protein
MFDFCSIVCEYVFVLSLSTLIIVVILSYDGYYVQIHHISETGNWQLATANIIYLFVQMFFVILIFSPVLLELLILV